MADETLTQNQMSILEHTAYRGAGGFYCGDSTDMQALVNKGLMKSVGFKSFCDDEFFKLTPAGYELMSANQE